MEKQGQKNPCSSMHNTCIKRDANMLETTALTKKEKTGLVPCGECTYAYH